MEEARDQSLLGDGVMDEVLQGLDLRDGELAVNAAEKGADGGVQAPRIPCRVGHGRCWIAPTDSTPGRERSRSRI